MGVLAHHFVREHDADGDLGAFGVQHTHLLFSNATDDFCSSFI